MQVSEAVARLRDQHASAVGLTRVLARWSIEAFEPELQCMLAEMLYGQARAADDIQRRLSELGTDITEPVDYPRDLVAAALSAENGPKVVDEVLVAILSVTVRGAHEHAQAARPIGDDPSRRVLLRWAAETENALMMVRDWRQAAPAVFGEDPPAWTELVPHAAFNELLAGQMPDLPSRDRRMQQDCNDISLPGEDSPVKAAAIRFLHYNVTELEIPTIEACSRLLLLHGPRMPWAFSVELARQAWDEARHAAAFLGRLRALGGELGDYAIGHDLWQMAEGQPLEICLALHQRIGEWIGVDGAIWNAQRFRQAGDEETSTLLDYVVADEITHVALGNRWLNFLHPDPADVARVHHAASNRRAEFGKSEDGPLAFPFNRWACERAEFSDEEIGILENRWRAFGSRVGD